MLREHAVRDGEHAEAILVEPIHLLEQVVPNHLVEGIDLLADLVLAAAAVDLLDSSLADEDVVAFIIDDHGLPALESHYAQLSRRLGFRVPVPEDDLKRLGFLLLDSGTSADLKAVARALEAAALEAAPNAISLSKTDDQYE